LPPRDKEISEKQWNAGFIRQQGKTYVKLPDKSGVPAVVSSNSQFNRCHAGEHAQNNFLRPRQQILLCLLP
jgi:hypothetical protein